MRIAVNSLGHAHPELVKTIKINQKSYGMYLMHFKFQREKHWLKSYVKTFADYVMFQNSGAEATEAAIKVAKDIFIQ